MKRSISSLALVVLLSGAVPCRADTETDALCTALLENEQTRLADDTLQVELGKSRLEAFERICELIDGLWKSEAIPRMTWLEAKHDRDAARLELERARLILARQRDHVEQLRAGCAAEAPERARRIREARRRYLQADCDQQAKAIEIAKVNLEFNREWLAGIRELREGSTGSATIQDVILAEMDVRLEEQRLADARARTELCRKRNPASD